MERKTIKKDSPRKVDVVGELLQVIVQIWKRDSILSSNWLPDDDLVDVVELVPIFIGRVHVLDERLKFRTARYGHVQRFGGEERFEIEQVEVVVVQEVGEQLIGQSIEGGQLWQL